MHKSYECTVCHAVIINFELDKNNKPPKNWRVQLDDAVSKHYANAILEVSKNGLNHGNQPSRQRVSAV